MKNSETPVIDSSNALTWPEGTPAVSMDIRLGRKDYKPREDRVDFDMAKYNELLQSKGLKADKRAKLRVNIVHPTNNDLSQPTGLSGFGKYTAGQYENGVANVVLGDKWSRETHASEKELSSSNHILLHETKHFLQDRKPGETSRRSSKKEILAKYYIAKYIVPLGLIASTGHLEKYGANEVDLVAYGGALASHLYARSMTMYRFHPREIAARRFANRYADKYGDIITTSPIDVSNEQLSDAA